MSGTLPVNELFDTIQGEAHWSGTPSTFLRLQGCEVGCPWCDTKHTWELGGLLEVTFTEVLEKVGDGALYARVDVDTLVHHIVGRAPRHVVITGGEPCKYDLIELTARLLGAGKTVQIETSGTQQIRVAVGTWVTVSPKVGMPGGFTVRQDALETANEVKMPVGKVGDVEALDALLAMVPVGAVWLQPLSTSPKATALCVQKATELGWRVSLQAHKYAGLR